MSLNEGYHHKAQEFVQRIRNEPDFLARLQADPLAVLQAEGLPDSLIPDLVRQGLIRPDVQGYSGWIDGCISFQDN